MNIPPDKLLPCGCLIRCSIVDGVNTLTISPCKLDCRNLINALDLAEEMKKDVEFRSK